MKKIFALILSLALMTGCLAAASGEIPEVWAAAAAAVASHIL